MLMHIRRKKNNNKVRLKQVNKIFLKISSKLGCKFDHRIPVSLNKVGNAKGWLWKTPPENIKSYFQKIQRQQRGNFGEHICGTCIRIHIENIMYSSDCFSISCLPAIHTFFAIFIYLRLSYFFVVVVVGVFHINKFYSIIVNLIMSIFSKLQSWY